MKAVQLQTCFSLFKICCQTINSKPIKCIFQEASSDIQDNFSSAPTPTFCQSSKVIVANTSKYYLSAA